jgi:hypothetical protein
MFRIITHPSFDNRSRIAYEGVLSPLCPTTSAECVACVVDDPGRTVQERVRREGVKPLDLLYDIRPYVGARDLYVVWRMLRQPYLGLRRYVIGQRLGDMLVAPSSGDGFALESFVQFSNKVGSGIIIDTHNPDPKETYLVVRSYTDSITVVTPDGERFESPAMRAALAQIALHPEAHAIIVVAHPDPVLYDEGDGFGYVDRIGSLQGAVVEWHLGRRTFVSALDGSECSADSRKRPIIVSTGDNAWRLSTFNVVLLGRPVERPDCATDIVIPDASGFACVVHRLGVRFLTAPSQPTASALRAWIESGRGRPAVAARSIDLDDVRSVIQRIVPMTTVPPDGHPTERDIDDRRWQESGCLAWMPGVFVQAMRKRSDVIVPGRIAAGELVDALKAAGVTHATLWGDAALISNLVGDTAFVRWKTQHEDRQ